MTPTEAAEIVEKFARRYVAEHLGCDGEDATALRAQGFAVLCAAAELRKLPDSASGKPK